MLMTLYCFVVAAALTVLVDVGFKITGWFLLFSLPIFVVFFLLAFALFLVFGFFTSISEDVHKPRFKPLKYFSFQFNFVNSFLCIWSGARIKITGAEKLEPDKKYLFVFNHRSNFDPMVLAHKFKKYKILMISKPGNFDIPVVGKTIHKAGYMPIDRDNDREAMKTVIQAAKYLESGKYSIGVCPEGTRNKTGIDLLPFKRGAFKIATRANAPIAIVAINGCEKIHKNFPLKPTKVYIDIVDVIPPERFEDMTTADISDEVAAALQKNIDERNPKKEVSPA